MGASMNKCQKREEKVDPVSGQKLEPGQMPIKWYYDFIKTVPEQSSKSKPVAVAITGCTTGIGYGACKASILKGVSAVLLLNRKSERAEKAVADLQAYAQEVGNKTVDIIQVDCDLQSFESVRSCSKKVNELCGMDSKYGGLDVLICNAAVAAMPDYRTKDGFDVQVQTAYLGHYILVCALVDGGALAVGASQKGESRMVMLSSTARDHWAISNKALMQKYFVESEPESLGGCGSMASFERYHQAKMSQTIFACGMAAKAAEMGSTNIKFVCADPGVIQTQLIANAQKIQNDLPWYKKSWLNTFMASVLGIGVGGTQALEDGTMTMLTAAFETTVENGDFFAPSVPTYMAKKIDAELHADVKSIPMGFIGPAVKILSKLQPTGLEPEKRKGYYTNEEEKCRDSKNQQNVMDWAEKATGVSAKITPAGVSRMTKTMAGA